MATGKEIKRLREQAGVSAENLSKWIGVKADRLRKWEQRDSDPKEADKVLVEKYFKVPIEEIGQLDKFNFHYADTKGKNESIEDIDEEKNYVVNGLRESISILRTVIEEKNKTIEDNRFTIENLKLMITSSKHKGSLVADTTLSKQL